MIDKARLREDAICLLDNPAAAWAAGTILRILDDPSLLGIPEGYALVKKPELLGIGVARR